jgi:hypothetical protein
MSCFIVFLDQPDLHQSLLSSIYGEYNKVRLPTNYGVYHTEFAFVWIFDNIEETAYFAGS